MRQVITDGSSPIGTPWAAATDAVEAVQLVGVADQGDAAAVPAVLPDPHVGHEPVHHVAELGVRVLPFPLGLGDH